jgi:hypothetical protein
MRAVIIALIAIGLMYPAIGPAAAQEGQAPAPPAAKKAERPENLLRKKPRARKQAKRRIAKSSPSRRRSSKPRPSAPASPPETKEQAARTAPCTGRPTGDTLRRCLSLAKLPAHPASITPRRTIEYVPQAALIAPSRSWLGSFTRYLIAGGIALTEALYAEDDETWRKGMAVEVQWELEQARLKQQSQPKVSKRP